MALSLAELDARPAFALLECTADDRYFDYCLEPYRPRRTWRGKLRPENVLWQSLTAGKCLDALRPPLLAVQAALGRDMTVWGAKWDGARLFWEVYVYDPEKEDPQATLTGLAAAVAPWLTIAPQVRESVPYSMVSFDLDADVVARRRVDEVNLYLTGEAGHAGRSYKVSTNDSELDNTYRFLDAKREVDQVLTLIKSSLFADYSDPARLSKVLIPELFACRKICVAKKRRRDAIYFSGIAVSQLLFFLRRFGYPVRIVDFVARNEARLDHLSFDVGIDYVQRDGAVVYPKTSFYGTL